MQPRTSCRFFKGLLGPQTPPAPLFGTSSALGALQAALNEGMTVEHTRSPTGQKEGAYALDIAVKILQQKGAIPSDLSGLSRLSAFERQVIGLPNHTLLHPSQQMQGVGTPAFKNIEIAFVLASLRNASAYHQYITGQKRVYQLGVLTLTAEHAKPHFQVQVFPAEEGLVTDTLWLYRWCAEDGQGGYVEHWCGFKLNGQIVPASQQQIFQPVPILPAPGKRSHSMLDDPGDDETWSEDTTRLNINPNPPKKRHRKARYQAVDISNLADDEVFAFDPVLIQGDTLLQLAERYSNSEIYERVNNSHPEPVIKSMNVITKRLTHAIAAYAERENMLLQEVRERLDAARKANGVVHKMKVYTQAVKASKREGTEGGTEAPEGRMQEFIAQQPTMGEFGAQGPRMEVFGGMLAPDDGMYEELYEMLRAELGKSP